MEPRPLSTATENAEEQIYRMKVELALTKRKFRQACLQIVYLNCRFGEVQERYDRAKEMGLPPFQYSYRLQMAAIEEVKNAYQDYAEIQAEKMKSLELELYGEILPMEHVNYM